jgi:hypothetical protein
MSMACDDDDDDGIIDDGIDGIETFENGDGLDGDGLDGDETALPTLPTAIPTAAP